MKTKVLILVVAIFSFSSCTKNVEEENGTIEENIITHTRNQGDGSDYDGYKWRPYSRVVFYDPFLSQTEIDAIREYIFDVFDSKHPSIRLQSYHIIGVNGHTEEYLGVHWSDGSYQGLPQEDVLTEEIDQQEGISWQ